MADANSNGNGRISLAPLVTILTVLIAAATLLGAVHFTIARPVEQALEDLKDRIESRYQDNRRDIDKLDDRLTDQIKSEQSRNNSIESRLAAEEKVTELFEGGKLLLNGASHE